MKDMSIFKLRFKLESIFRCFKRRIYLFLKALVFHETRIKKKKRDTMHYIPGQQCQCSNQCGGCSPEGRLLRSARDRTLTTGLGEERDPEKAFV